MEEVKATAVAPVTASEAATLDSLSRKVVQHTSIIAVSHMVETGCFDGDRLSWIDSYAVG